MKSIVFIIPYFGKFNNYFSFWLNSAKNNPTVNWIIFTDNKISELPDNVKVVETSFEEIKNKINKHVGFTTGLTSPYKFCDFKPLYSIFFKEYVAEYDFWGHCDMDVIFGDIRKFMTPTILDKYDRILSRGHFTLYRNTEEIANLYLTDYSGIDSWKDAFSKEYVICFDEWGGVINGVKWMGLSNLWKDKKSDVFYDEIIFDDIVVGSEILVSAQKRTWDSEKTKKNIIFIYDKGKLYQSFIRNGKLEQEETLYIHLQKRKMEIKTQNTNQFIIIPNEFIDFVKKPSFIYHKYYSHKSLYSPKIICYKVYQKLKRIIKK